MRTTRKVMGSLVVVGVSGFFALAGQALAQGATDAAMDAAIKEMTVIRGEVAGRLEARMKAAASRGESVDLFLRLQEGVDEQQTLLTARRRGGEWMEAYLTVPAWHLETMNEKRNNDHRNGVGLNAPDKFRFPVDMTRVALDANGLNGRMDALVRLNKTREERLPPGAPIAFHTGEVYSWMDRWVPLVHEKVRCQAFELKMRGRPDRHEFELVFRKAVLGRADFILQFRMPEDDWVRPVPRTPNFNAGYHDSDTSGLTYKDGALTGTLKVTINPDRWFPKTPEKMELKVDGRLENGYFKGLYEVVGAAKQPPGVIEGRGGTIVDGFFSASGDLGKYESLASGFVSPARQSVMPLLDADLPSGDSIGGKSGRLIALYRQVRALSMADAQFPLPLDEALRQARVAQPVWTTNAAAVLTAEESSAMLAHAAAMVGWAKAALDKDPLKGLIRGFPEVSDPRFGPFYGTKPLEASATTGAWVLPGDTGKTGPQKWAYVPEWSIVGPLDIESDMDDNLSALPDVVPVDAGMYELKARILPKADQPKAGQVKLGGWSKLSANGGRLVPPWSPLGGRGAARGSVTFAKASIDAPKYTEAWVSVAAKDYAKMWINGRLAWVADEQSWAQRGAEEAIMKVALRKGSNEVLFRLREDRSDCWLKFAVCLQGAPRPADVAVVQDDALKSPAPVTTVDDRGDGSGHFSVANPPLAWDIESGKNIAWKQPIAARLRAGPVARSGRLFMTCGNSTVTCLDQGTGKTQWQAELNILEATDKDAFEQWSKASEADQKQILAKAKQNWDWGSDGLVVEGNALYVHHRSGVLAAYDFEGKRKWMLKTDMRESSIWVVEGKVLLEGTIRSGKDVLRRAMAVATADGTEVWSVSSPQRYRFSGVLRIPARDKAIVALLSGDRVLDIASGQPLLEGLDIDTSSEGSGILVENDMLYMTQLLRRNAVRFFVDGDGQLGYRQAWDSRYVTKECNTAFTGCTADRWLLTAGTVGEDRPGHSPVSLGEINIHNRVTGEPVGRIKPVFYRGRMQWSQITVAGAYGFVPDQDGRQMAVLHLPAWDVPYLINTNGVEEGTRAPVFDGDRMFLVSGSNVFAVSCASAEGKAYQDGQIADYVLSRVGLMEGDGAPKPLFKPLPAPPDPAKVPLARMGDEPGIVNWLVAGPFPTGDNTKLLDALAGMTVEIGQEVDVGGTKLRFAPFPYQKEISSCISFNYHLLEGFGMTVIAEERKIDAGAAVGTNDGQSVVLYTVLANSKPRLMTVTGPDAACRMWLGGRPIKSAISVHLDAGYYPLTLKIDTAALAKDPLVRVAFANMDEPQEVKKARAVRFGDYVPWLEGIVSKGDESPRARRAALVLADLDQARGILDGDRAHRSVRNNGTGVFDLGCIPVPMSKDLNLRWTAEAAGSAGCDPVAAGAWVFAAASSPAAIVAFDARTGKQAWSSPIEGARDGEVSAPAVNNGRVCAVSAGGVAQCCSIDGKTLWTKTLQKSRSRSRPSVLAVGGVFVVQCGSLTAIDATTGEVRWNLELGKGVAAAPVLKWVGTAPVILTSEGVAVRAGDGTALCDKLSGSGSVSMQADSRRVYACDGGVVTAVELPEFAVKGEAWRKVWTAKLPGKAVCQPVSLDGKLYVLTAGQLTALDAATGEELGSEKMDGTDASSLTVVGGRLIVANAGKENRTVVFRTHPTLATGVEIGATAPLANPSFAKGLAVFGSGASLYAIGGGDPTPPSVLDEPAAVNAPAGFEPAKDVPIAPFSDNDVPLRWIVSDPLPKSGLDIDCLSGIGGEAKATPGTSTTVKFGDKTYGFKPIPVSAFWRSAKFTSGMDAMTVPKAIDATNACTAYLYTVVDVPDRRYVRFELLCWPGKNWPNTNDCHISVWVSGKAIESGDMIVLDKGKHPVMLRANQGHVRGANIYIVPRFVDLTDIYADLRARNEKQRALWDAFQKVKDQRLVLGR